MEPRLINANDLERYAVYREDGHRYVPWLAIAEVPTAETDHAGWWVRYKSERYRCSVCGFEAGGRVWRYCPNCGAKMDGGAPDAER